MVFWVEESGFAKQRATVDALENPILWYELKTRLRIPKLIPAIVLRFACLALIFLLILLSRLGRGILAFILAEAFLVLLFTPGAVCSAFAGISGRCEFGVLALTRLSSGAIFLGKLAGANLYNCVIILLSALVMCTLSFFHGNLNTWHIITASAVLLTLAFASSVVGLALSMLFRRNTFAAYTLAYVLILLLTGSVVIPGPLIERMNGKAKTTAAKVVLYANPIIMTSRALGRVDIMRTRYMYELADPIVGPGFAYPNWYHAGAIYLIFSCLLLVPASIGFAFARRTISIHQC